MYIKNRRISSKIKGLGSCQTLLLTESFVLRNRLLFIYKPLPTIKKNKVMVEKVVALNPPLLSH